MAAAGVFDYDQEQDDEDEVSSLDSGSSERLRRERPKESSILSQERMGNDLWCGY